MVEKRLVFAGAHSLKKLEKAADPSAVLRYQNHNNASSYRADIDGLRTLAVIPVVLYHLGTPFVSGGYVGVDVFFVISGFLITGIINRELQSKSFSIIRFYERRFRRILPALFFVIAIVAIASWFILLPQDFEDFGESVVATALFASNLLFWHQTNYFDAAVDTKPLIHTWSLALEEQYYLLFPPLLAGLWRWASHKVVITLLMITIGSFVVCCVGVAQGWSAAYYLLPFRAWELLIGSMLALVAVPTIPSRWLREAIGIIGLACIVGPALLLTSESPFPGYNALLPVLGSALLLGLGARPSETPTLATRILSLRLFVWIGLISYSLYLWHWPVIVLTKYVTLGQMTAPIMVVVFVSCLMLAWASWRFVERPFRNKSVKGSTIFAFSAFVTATASVAGGVLVSMEGVRSRFPEVAQIEKGILAQRAADKKAQCMIGENGLPWRGPEYCFVTRGSGTRILLWGDSHANHFVQALRELNGSVKGTILAYGMTACTPILDLPSTRRPNCIPAKNRVLELVREHRIQRVIISGYWSAAPQSIATDQAPSLADTVRRLKALGVDVAIIGDSPVFYLKEPVFLYARALAAGSAVAPLYIPTRNDPLINSQIRRIVGNKNFFDPLSVLCKKSECLALDKGEPLFVDDHHLSRFGAKRLLVAMGSMLD